MPGHMACKFVLKDPTVWFGRMAGVATEPQSLVYFWQLYPDLDQQNKLGSMLGGRSGLEDILANCVSETFEGFKAAVENQIEVSNAGDCPRLFEKHITEN